MSNARDVTRREFLRKSALSGASILASGMALHDASAQVDVIDSGVLEAERPGANAEGSTILENEIIRIELSTRNGDITGLFNERTGKEYIVAGEWTRAFRLNVPLPNRVTEYNADYSAKSFDSWRQIKCNITREKNADCEIVRVQYPSLDSEAGTFQIEVNYSICLPNNSDEAILQIEIANHTPYKVKEVFFPWVSGVGAVESDRADAFVAPNIIRPGGELWREHEHGSNWEEYPYLLRIPSWPSGYSLSMPWMNSGSKGEGLYLASLSRDGARHMLMVQNCGNESARFLPLHGHFPHISLRESHGILRN